MGRAVEDMIVQWEIRSVDKVGHDVANAAHFGRRRRAAGIADLRWVLSETSRFGFLHMTVSPHVHDRCVWCSPWSHRLVSGVKRGVRVVKGAASLLCPLGAFEVFDHPLVSPLSCGRDSLSMLCRCTPLC